MSRPPARAPLRIAVVLPDLRVGGLQELAVRLAASLDRGEFDPRCYTFDGGGPLQDDLRRARIPHTDLPRPPGLAPRYAARLARHLLGDAVELVHCHNVTALYHGGRAARRAGRLPVLFTEHDREMPAPWKHRLLHRWIVRRATRIAVVSAGLLRDLVRYEGFPRARSQTLFNGVPDPRAAFGGDRGRARAELGWDGRPVLLAVGSLTAVKNHAGLLRAMTRVRTERPEARLVVAGQGELGGALAEQARQQLPPGAVTWLGERRDVPRLLAACDLFVLPSHREGLPLSLIEAHGAGRASVCYDVGGNGEVVAHGETGWLVPPGDEAALAARIAGALADERARQAAGAAARRRFSALFTHERMVAGYVALYRELAAGGRG